MLGQWANICVNLCEHFQEETQRLQILNNQIGVEMQNNKLLNIYMDGHKFCSLGETGTNIYQTIHVSWVKTEISIVPNLGPLALRLLFKLFCKTRRLEKVNHHRRIA
jgi:hypothetical protein